MIIGNVYTQVTDTHSKLTLLDLDKNVSVYVETAFVDFLKKRRWIFHPIRGHICCAVTLRPIGEFIRRQFPDVKIVYSRQLW